MFASLKSTLRLVKQVFGWGVLFATVVGVIVNYCNIADIFNTVMNADINGIEYEHQVEEYTYLDPESHTEPLEPYFSRSYVRHHGYIGFRQSALDVNPIIVKLSEVGRLTCWSQEIYFLEGAPIKANLPDLTEQATPLPGLVCIAARGYVAQMVETSPNVPFVVETDGAHQDRLENEPSEPRLKPVKHQDLNPTQRTTTTHENHASPISHKIQ